MRVSNPRMEPTFIQSARIFDPAVVRSPAVEMLSLMATGTREHQKPFNRYCPPPPLAEEEDAVSVLFTTTWPPFMTQRTPLRTTLISASGSPCSATMSA
jgi:hypothetical protein